MSLARAIRTISSIGIASFSLWAVAMAITPTPIYAATPPDSCFNFNATKGNINGYYLNESNNTANPACPKDVDIPSTIGGVTVKSIGDFSFYERGLTAVTIPDSVEIIYNNAFRENQLSSVVIPDSVKKIYTSAFSDNQLTSVVLGSSLKTIDSRVFWSNRLTSIIIPDNITSIEDSAFYNNQLTSLAIPDSVTSIGSQAFSRNKLTSVKLGSSVKTIGDRAFDVNSITSITLPSSVESDPNSFMGHQGDNTISTFDASTDATKRADFLAHSWYVQVYTEDPSNPRGFKDGATFYSTYAPGAIYSDGGQFIYSGVLINPAQVTVNYLDENQTKLADSTATSVGKDGDRVLADYILANGPTLPKVTIHAVPQIPTAEEALAVQSALKAYYHAGDTYTATASSIAGYSTITPSSPYAATLKAGANNIDFVYSNPSASDNGTNELASTGIGVAAIAGSALAMLVISSTLIVVKRKI